MSRLLAAAVAATLVAVPARADGPAGSWKFQFADGPQSVTFLLSLSESGGKWVGDFVASSAQLKQEPKFASIAVAGDSVRFTLTFSGKEFINFDGVLAKDGKKISGSYTQFGTRLRLTELYPSKLKKLDDPVDLARENVFQMEPGTDLFDAGITVAEGAAARKIPVEEIRGIADRLGKAAAGYGSRWEQSIALRMASALIDQKGYADVALAQARRAERLTPEDASALTQMTVADTLARALTAAGKPDEAKTYAATAAKLEAKDFAEYTKATMAFPVEPFAGRKGGSKRAVLAEIFTGAECPPCVAVDVAGDAILKAYPPTDVILLQYHFHVPGPDPLTSPDGMDRVAYYGEAISGAPTLMLNGKAGPAGGGSASAAKEKLAEIRAAIDPLLEKPAGAKLTLTVSKAEKGGYTAKAVVTDLESPGEKTSLRFALAEERVRYAGGNGVRYHHHVVRAMPGGIKGFPLTKKDAEHTVTFDPAEIREKLTTYLDVYAKEERDFPRPDRPLALKNLKLVAIVQNDTTGDVFQAVQADVDGK